MKARGWPVWLLLMATPGPAEEPAAPEPPAIFFATATVRERPVASATGSLTLLDRRTIEESGAQTVAELLAFVPGMSLTTNGTRGGLTTAQIRGGDPNFTLVLLDGVPLNDGTYQVGEIFNLEALPTAAIERVEILRGPLSAFYGSTGLAGAIHIVTRRGESGAPRGEIEATAGDASLRALRGALGGGSDKARYFLSLAGEGEEERIARERFELANVQGNLELDLAARVRLRLTGRAAAWEGDDYPEASGGPELGSGELRRADNDEASLGMELLLGESSGRLQKLSAALYRHRLERTSPAIFPLVPASTERTRFTRTRLGWALSLGHPGARGDGANGPGSRLRLSLGADLQREEGDNDSVLFLPPFLGGELPGDYALERTTPGAWLEMAAERGRLLIELGGRLDLPEGASSQFSPRVGLSYRPGGGATRLRASAGRAFKLPSFFALASPPALGGNPDLRPEVMLGVDVGVERELAGPALTGSVTLFSNRYRELVDFDFDLFSSVNRSKVEARGVELDLGWRPGARWSLAANLTWQDVQDADTGARLRQRPHWVGGLRLAWRPRPALSFHLDGRGLSSYRDEQIPVPGRRSVAGRTLWGARGSWSFAPGYRLEVRLDNLLDERYETLIGFPGAGRSARLGLRARLGGGPVEP